MSLNFKLIGRRVKETRTLRRISQAELAERIDKSVPYISHIEIATKQASLTTLVQIANALGVTFISTLAQEESHIKSRVANDSVEKRFRRGIFLSQYFRR